MKWWRKSIRSNWDVYIPSLLLLRKIPLTFFLLFWFFMVFFLIVWLEKIHLRREIDSTEWLCVFYWHSHRSLCLIGSNWFWWWFNITQWKWNEMGNVSFQADSMMCKHTIWLIFLFYSVSYSFLFIFFFCFGIMKWIDMRNDILPYRLFCHWFFLFLYIQTAF